ncbi:MAG: transporter substrate-binding domain-containing protein [Xenococcaceae cyanobacterium]
MRKLNRSYTPVFRLPRTAHFLIGLAIAGLASLPASAQGQKLQVGVAGSAPFVIKDEGKIKGISIDIWEEIASAERFDYELIPQENVPAGLNAVAQGKLDVLIGPISITPQRLAREKIEFTQPYFISQFGLLLPALRPSLWSRVAPLFGLAALSSIALLLVLLLIVGNLIWLAERRSNPEQFPPEYSNGVRNGIWFALVTLTTVGYGDRAPVTKAGQLIAGIWMVVTLVTVSSLTAGLASALTAVISGEKARERFRSLKDLAGARMAVVAKTAGAELAEDYQVILTERETLEKAINLVVKEQTDGVIFDRPALRYYVRQHPELKLRVSPLILGSDTYGFVVPANNDVLMKKLNFLLLELRAERRVREIADEWLTISNSEAQ